MVNWEDVPENTCQRAKNMVSSYHRSSQFRTTSLKCPQCQVPHWAELETGGSDRTPSSLRIMSGSSQVSESTVTATMQGQDGCHRILMTSRLDYRVLVFQGF